MNIWWWEYRSNIDIVTVWKNYVFLELIKLKIDYIVIKINYFNANQS